MSELQNEDGRLKALFERIERVEMDLVACQTDRKELYSEAKGHGYNVKLMKKAMRIRKQPKAERQEEEAMLDTYLAAAGVE